MIKFAQLTTAPEARTKDSRKISLLLAGALTIMAVTQLFGFEEFIVTMQQTFPYGGAGVIIAAVIVAAEVFALPFLLRMDLSKAFRWLSAGCVGLVALLWLVVSSWGVLTYPDVEVVGFIGSFDPLGPGLWAVFVSIALAMLSLWSIWGLWPGTRKK